MHAASPLSKNGRMDVRQSAWLMPLRQALRTALLAELDTRMQPTLGLLEAFNLEHAQQQ